MNHIVGWLRKSRESLLRCCCLTKSNLTFSWKWILWILAKLLPNCLLTFISFLKLINMPNYLLTLYSSFDYLLAGMEFHLIVSNLNRISFSMILLWNCVGWAVLETLSIDWLLHWLKKIGANFYKYFSNMLAWHF